MTQKDTPYKVSLSGGKVTVKDEPVSEEVARKIINLIMGVGAGPGETSPGSQGGANLAEGNDDTSASPKAFMVSKKPSSEIERITCLAYYLANHRDTTAFKTKDITKLNREAAQPDFSNATAFMRNADAAGYLAKAGGGSKQISALGEAVVEALPDREAVKKAIDNYRVTRKRRTSAKRAKKAAK